MYKKIFDVVTLGGLNGVRLKKDYLRPNELQGLKMVIEMLGGKFLPRINMWSLHPNDIPRLKIVVDHLVKQVDSRAELGLTTEKEYREELAARAAKVLSSRKLKSEIYKYRGPYCEGCGGKRQVRYRLIPISVGGTDELDNFRVLCRSCQTRIRQYLNKCVMDEQLKNDPTWFHEKYDEAVTKMVDGEI